MSKPAVTHLPPPPPSICGFHGDRLHHQEEQEMMEIPQARNDDIIMETRLWDTQGAKRQTRAAKGTCGLTHGWRDTCVSTRYIQSDVDTHHPAPLTCGSGSSAESNVSSLQRQDGNHHSPP
ncbi:hypothetical protein NHX12_020601 [Muraenolepis orangiensis]|uniref:Uncharacterized protein n=1 Tax=Muraenolepis orangiensis TaxID=630683 RepID=A0A9Q0IW01_9TELE|nr:hypothetical protein NHX12_020601 [Muraenolepis orangiensis]